MSIDIEWAEPPVSNRHGRWAPIADELRANPGKWACVARGASPSLGYNLRSGRLKGVKALEFEVRTVKTENGRADIYMRYPDAPARERR